MLSGRARVWHVRWLSRAPISAHLLLAVRGDHVHGDLTSTDAVPHALRRRLLHGGGPRGVPRLHAVPIQVKDRLRRDRRVLPLNAACGGKQSHVNQTGNRKQCALCMRQALTKQVKRSLGAEV